MRVPAEREPRRPHDDQRRQIAHATHTSTITATTFCIAVTADPQRAVERDRERSPGSGRR